MNRCFSFVCVMVFSALVARNSSAATFVVESLAPAPAVGIWTLETTGATGAGSIVSLSGEGGNLEANQPLPVGAVKLTTGADVSDSANIFLRQDFGLASSFMTNTTLGYSYYKGNVGDLAPAPTLMLEIEFAGGAGDNFGTLFYEPRLNPLGNPPTEGWQTITVNSTTGMGPDAADGWWWNGGFGIADNVGSSGNSPYRSLAEWSAAFTLADPNDFGAARVVGIGVGVGPNHLNQVGYVDRVNYQSGTTEMMVYNFELSRVVSVPEPASVMLLVFGVLGLCARRRRQA